MTGHWQAHQNPKGQRGHAARNPQGSTPIEFGSWSICIDHEDQRARYEVIKPDNPQGSDPSCRGPWRILTQAIRDLSRQGPETLDWTPAGSDSEQGSPVRLPTSASRGHH